MTYVNIMIAGIEATFISKGFSNWKNATIKFTAHEQSNCHKEAVMKIISLPATTNDIGESLSQLHKKEKLERQQCFLKILTNIKILARQGIDVKNNITCFWNAFNDKILHIRSSFERMSWG